MLSYSAPSHGTSDAWPGSDLVPTWWPLALTGITVRSLSRDDCLHLLATETTGRLFVLQRPAHPVQIRYRVSDGGLVIEPPPEISGSPGDRPQLVMVCVDRLDPDELHGWSLVVVGALSPGAIEPGEPADAGPDRALLDLRSLTGKSFATSPKRHLELALRN